MKASFCLAGDWFASKPELVELLGRLGYDAVEIWPQAFDALRLPQVKARLEGAGLALCSVNTYFDFTSSNTTFRRSLVDAGVFLGRAAELGAPYMRVLTSRMNAYKSAENVAPTAWARAVEGIGAVCEMARAFGICCLMEVHGGDGQLYDNSENTLRLLREVNAPNLKVNLQPPLRGEDWYESARTLGPHTVHVHANNWRGEWGNFCMLGEGDLDFARFLRILRGFGFDGCVSVEHAHRDPMGVAEHELPYLRALFRELEA